MDKKGKIELETIIYLLIGLFALSLIIYFFFLSPGGLQAATKLGEKLGLSNLPGKLEEKEKEMPEERIPEELKNSYNDLIKNLKFWKDSDKTNCLIKFKAFPDNFENNIINIHLVEDTKEYGLTIINKLEQSLLPNVIKEIVPCYAGSDLSVRGITNINIEKKDTLKSVEILGEEFNLLYKKDKQYICFLENCGNDCLQQILLIDKKIDFCDKSYKEIFDFKDVFFEGTHYGNLEEWNKGKDRMYYRLGEDMENSNVAYTFHVKGLSNPEFKKVFDIKRRVEHPSEEGKKGVFYKREYYGMEKDWCYKQIVKSYRFDEWKWSYKGEEDVSINEINTNLKDELFGPPDYSPKCEEVK